MRARWNGYRIRCAVYAALLLGGSQVGGEETKPAAAMPKVTYDDVQAVFREHCLTCHNQNQSKGGLALDSYAKTMEGGSSGQVVLPGDLESSRLWALVSHAEEPAMPPMQDKLAEAKLAVIKSWIENGALENKNSQAVVKKKSAMSMAAPAGASRPAGEPAMPPRLWKQPVVATERGSAVSAVAASPWAPLVAVAGQQQIVLYHADTGAMLGILPFPEGIPYVLRFSRNGELLLAGGGRGGASGAAVVFNVRTGRRVMRVGDELDAVLAADISSDHKYIALGGPQRMLRVYSTETGEMLHDIKKHTDWIYTIEFSPDGVLLASGDRANGLFVWEADTGQLYLDLRGHGQAVTDISWRPDSNVLASASLDGTVRLWEMNEGRQLKSWNAHGGGVSSVEFAHDGRLASCGIDRVAKTWNAEGNPERTFPALTEAALEVAMTHDGRRVVAGDWNGVVRMWDAADAKELAHLPPNPPTLQKVLEARQAQAAADAAAREKSRSELAMAEKLARERQAAAKAAAEQLALAMKMAQEAAAAQAEQEKVVTAARQAAGSAEARVAASQAAATEAAAELQAFDKARAELKSAAEQSRRQAVEAATRREQFEQDRKSAAAAVAEKAAVIQKLAAELEALKGRFAQVTAEQQAAAKALDAKAQELQKSKQALEQAESGAEQAAQEFELFQAAYGTAP